VGGNPALHWLFRKIAYVARKPGNDERVRPLTARTRTVALEADCATV
jgi:hypothetical protein